jgi:hypothetical protein
MNFGDLAPYLTYATLQGKLLLEQKEQDGFLQVKIMSTRNPLDCLELPFCLSRGTHQDRFGKFACI